MPPPAPRGPAASAGTRPGSWAAVGPGGRDGSARGPGAGGPESGVASAASSSRSQGPGDPGSTASSRKAEARRRLKQQLQCGAFIVPGPPSHHLGASGPAALDLRGSMGAAESKEGVTKPQAKERPWQMGENRNFVHFSRHCCYRRFQLLIVGAGASRDVMGALPSARAPWVTVRPAWRQEKGGLSEGWTQSKKSIHIV